MFGYDAISANIGAIPASAAYVFGYVSGSSYIVWNQAMFNRFPHAVKEYIDQGNGAPWKTPTIIDVENGAFNAAQLPALVKQYPGVKVYCNQSTLPEVYKYYRGRVWVAAPGTNADTIKANVEKAYPGLEVFAVQNTWTHAYDQSVIYPPKPVIPPPPHPVATIEIDGFKVPQPSALHIPVVISWWGNEGITRRQTTLNRIVWEAIQWEK